MRSFTLLSIFLLSMIFTFGQTLNFDPNDVTVLKSIRDNASTDSPLKTEWLNDSNLATWSGIKWTDTTPKKVIELQLAEKKLVSLDVTKLDKLEILVCYGGDNYFDNKLTSLDLKGLINLESLDCSGNLLTSLDLKDLTKLGNLWCANNRLSFSSIMATLNMTLSSFSKIWPQKEVFENVKNTKIGDVLDFSAEANVNGTATVFTWFKNGKLVEGTDQTGKYKVEEYGNYYCTMTNAKFPGLTLTTYPCFVCPTVVDNSKWFPPVRSQEVLANCTHFSLIYYLKSSIWNKQFNRDPNLEINQFNHNFVWNQNSPPDAVAGNASSAFMYMKSQGCATVADFLTDEQTTDYKPDFEIRGKALAFKSKKFYTGNFLDCVDNLDLIRKRIESLKDSLRQGKCFTLGLGLHAFLLKLTPKYNVYNCHKSINHNLDSIWTNHAFTIIGYNDTIKTVEGRGAFQVINSNKEVAGGRFYLDYNWFYFARDTYQYCFLEEDFTSVPKIVMNLKLSNSIKSTDIENGNFIFTDTLANQYNRRIDFEKYFIDCNQEIHDTLLENRNAKFDFENNWAYKFKRNTVQIIGLNNSRIPLRNNLTTWPQYNDDGRYELVTDLTSLCSVDKFKSLSVIIFDPVSSVYLDENGQTIYSYQREANAKIDQAYIDFLGTDNKIIAKVMELNDTTITTNDFYSQRAGWHLKPVKENIYVKSCTSVLKRKLVTFSISDIETNRAPIFTEIVNSDLITKLDSPISFAFKASDPENSAISYSITYGVGASIDQTTGLFTYSANRTGRHLFIVSASDGVNSVSTKVNVQVEEPRNGASPLFRTIIAQELHSSQGDFTQLTVNAVDPEGVPVTYSIVGGTGATIDPNTGSFQYHALNIGTHQFKIGASDGYNVTTFDFNIVVEPNLPPVFTSKPDNQTLTQNNSFQFYFKADDPENRDLTYSITEGNGASIDPVFGVFTFPAKNAGTFNFKVSVSDGLNIVSFPFSIKVNASTANNPPVFTQIPNGDLVVTSGQLASFIFKATDPENSPITYSIGGGLGASIDAATGLFQYQPSSVGRFTYRIDASDGLNIVSTIINVNSELKTAVNSELKYLDYSLIAYPNPFKRNTTIEFTLAKRQLVRLSIFNIMGHQVREVANNVFDTGKHQVVFDSEELQDGIYMVQLQTEAGRKTVKLKLIR